jgi:hypothetical protein
MNTMSRLFFCMLGIFLAGMLTSCDGISIPTGGQAFAETSFTVEPGERHTVAVPLEAGRRVEGSFSVSGAEDTIDFYVNGPDRELVFGVIRAVGGESFEVRAKTAGTHTLVFDNSISFGLPRQIALRYRTR